MKNNLELLAPAGDMEKLKTALHFGADAVYFAGKKFGLRAFATNFENIGEAVNYCHNLGKKAYVTVNIYPRNNDLEELERYIKELAELKVDGVIVSDIGIMDLVNRVAPGLELHVSTQANTTNINSAISYVKHFNAKRIILARELPLSDISLITKSLKLNNVDVEVFVHGAMCISYSGRCLLSNYLTGRDSNRGECAQACRYSYKLIENEDDPDNGGFAKERGGNEFPILEDQRGTYILNSKDMCMVNYMQEIINAGVKSFKIEGRMKSPYYLATVVNVYRRVIDSLVSGKKDEALKPENYIAELEKCSHRKFTTGFMVDEKDVKQNYESSHQTQTSNFLGVVKNTRTRKDGKIDILVEMRNRFKLGDVVEVLSPGVCFNKRFKIAEMQDGKGENIVDAKNVQQQVWVNLESEDKSINLTQEGNLLLSIMQGDIIRSVN